jgi:hypothetical protein
MTTAADLGIAHVSLTMPSVESSRILAGLELRISLSPLSDQTPAQRDARWARGLHAVLAALADFALPESHDPETGDCHCSTSWAKIDLVPKFDAWFDPEARAAFAAALLGALVGVTQTLAAGGLVGWAEAPLLLNRSPDRYGAHRIGETADQPRESAEVLIAALIRRHWVREPVLVRLLHWPRIEPWVDHAVLREIELGLHPLAWLLVRQVCKEGMGWLSIGEQNDFGRAAKAAALGLCDRGLLRRMPDQGANALFERGPLLRRPTFRAQLPPGPGSQPNRG